MQEKNAGGTPAAPIKLDVSVRVIEPVKNLMGFASVKFNDHSPGASPYFSQPPISHRAAAFSIYLIRTGSLQYLQRSRP